MHRISRFVALICVLSLTLIAQVPPVTYANKIPSPNAPSGSCNTATTPVYNYLSGVYYYCVPNTAPPTNLGTWTPAPTNAVVLATGTVSVPLSLTQLTTMFTTPVPIIPAQGAGTLIEVTSCILDLTFGSAAFTGGGTVTIGYGTTQSTVAASTATSTIASTVLTSFSANQNILVNAAIPVTASSLNLNTAVSITNGSAVFAAGTGGSGRLDCSYRVHPGLS
jgi:hypothetical protein